MLLLFIVNCKITKAEGLNLSANLNFNRFRLILWFQMKTLSLIKRVNKLLKIVCVSIFRMENKSSGSLAGALFFSNLKKITAQPQSPPIIYYS